MVIIDSFISFNISFQLPYPVALQPKIHDFQNTDIYLIYYLSNWWNLLYRREHLAIRRTTEHIILIVCQYAFGKTCFQLIEHFLTGHFAVSGAHPPTLKTCNHNRHMPISGVAKDQLMHKKFPVGSTPHGLIIGMFP